MSQFVVLPSLRTNIGVAVLPPPKGRVTRSIRVEGANLDG
jgi:hypothetical protein